MVLAYGQVFALEAGLTLLTYLITNLSISSAYDGSQGTHSTSSAASLSFCARRGGISSWSSSLPLVGLVFTKQRKERNLETAVS